MSILLIIFCIWSASALIRSAREKRAREKAQRIAYEQDRIKREMREMKQRASEEVAARIALEREQMRQRREQERLSAEQAKQAEQLAKHEKRIADLEFKAEQASADIEHLRVVLDDLNESFELACQMADKAHAAGDDKREEQAKNKILTLRNKIHSAESRLAKAQHTREMAQRELAA
jgi:chromosome segregation ATPase